MAGTRKLILSYRQTQISELTLRKALYWMSNITPWTLELEGEQWKVCFECDENEIAIKQKFEVLINDYLLRDVLDSKTSDLKQAIIKKSLKDLSLQ